MNCPKCKTDTRIVQSKRIFANGIRRKRECTKCGYKFSSYEFAEDLVADYLNDNRYISTKADMGSLCWKCKNATGFCPWSQNFEPVEGWKAEATIIKESQCVEIESYNILECPLFEADERSAE